MTYGASKRISLFKRFLHDRLHSGSTVGNSHFECSYNYVKNPAYPQDFDEGRNGYVINISLFKLQSSHL